MEKERKENGADGETARPGVYHKAVRNRLLRDDASHFEDLIGVAPFVVVPGADFDEGRVELDTSLDVEDGGTGIVAEVGGDDGIFCVTENALEFAFGGFFHSSADFFIAGRLFEFAGQVDERDVRGRDADGHAGELAVELGENLADCLGSAGGGRNHVFEDTAAASPVLLGRTVNGLLGGGGSMDCGHEAALDTELVIEDLGNRGKAVGGAGSVGDNLLTGIGHVVDTVDEHRGGILGRSGHDNFLGTSLQVSRGQFFGQEEAGGFDNDVDIECAPSDGGGIFFSEDLNLLAVNDHEVAIDLDVMIEDTMDRVILEHVCQIIRVQKVVDSDDFDVIREVFDGSTENHATNSSESVDTDFNSHFFTP